MRKFLIGGLIALLPTLGLSTSISLAASLDTEDAALIISTLTDH